MTAEVEKMTLTSEANVADYSGAHDDVAADDPRIASLQLEEPNSVSALFRNVDRIKDLLKSEAAAGDALGRDTPLAARAMRDAGVFAMTFPKRRGGIEISIPDQIQILAQIARINAGTAWTAAALSASGNYAAQLSDEGYADLYRSIDTPTIYSSGARAIAVDVGDGFIVKKGARWDFGSGIYHAERYIGGVGIVDAEGAPLRDEMGGQLSYGLYLPPEKVHILHNWDTLGIRSSGSSSFMVNEDILVLKKHAFGGGFPLPSYPDAPAILKHQDTSYFCLMAIAVGVAQHALDLTIETVRSKAARSNGKPSALALVCIERASMEVNAMICCVRGMASYLQDALETPGRMLSPDELGMMWTFGTPLRDGLNRVLDLCLDVYGAGYSIDPTSEFRRIVGDASVLRGHQQFRPPENGESSASRGRAPDLVENLNSQTTLLDTPWTPRNV